VVEGFRPGVMGRFGLDYGRVREANSQIVYCSISGFGQFGPYANRPGHDLNYQAIAGMLQNELGELASVPHFPVIDMAVGLLAALCIVAAVHRAREAGEGQHLDVSMSDLALSMNLLGFAGVARMMQPFDNELAEPPGSQFYGYYRTADDRYLAVGNFEQKFWDAFVIELGLPELGPARLATGEEARAVKTAIQRVIETEPLQVWSRRFASVDVCVTPVLTPVEALRDPHHVARDLVRWEGDKFVCVGFPARLSATPAAREGSAPGVGEHAHELLRAAGFDEDELRAFAARGVI
jgi:alpha-methylacyl-CoA racemase